MQEFSFKYHLVNKVCFIYDTTFFSNQQRFLN